MALCRYYQASSSSSSYQHERIVSSSSSSYQHGRIASSSSHVIHSNRWEDRKQSKKIQHYETPLGKLDKLTARYRPKKFAQNNKYMDQCRTGLCKPFEPLSDYKQYYIHRRTSIDTLNKLIYYANQTMHYTIDTEGQLQRPSQPSKAALVQIEFIRPYDSSIVVLIEALHLPSRNSPVFQKIRELCKIIFSMNHYIYSWGSVSEELEKFYKFALFDADDIRQPEKYNIQGKFYDWFHSTHPFSDDDKYGTSDTYSLQSAIHLTFNEWLNKRMTLANWGCGIDFNLQTYIPFDASDPRRNEIVQAEEEIRLLMEQYAIFDCMAVTKLMYPVLFDWTKAQTENYHRSLALCTSNDVGQLVGEVVHVDDELPPTNYEQVSDDDDELPVMYHIDEPQLIDISEDELPPYCKLNLAPLVDVPDDELPDHCRLHLSPAIHVLNESRQHTTTTHAHANRSTRSYRTRKQQRTRQNNIRKRIQRYKYQVIRHVYHRFTTTQVKNIIKSMNIYFKNIKINRHTLIIGLKNTQITAEVEQLLHDRMFTKQHYQRLYPSKEQSKSTSQ